MIRPMARWQTRQKPTGSRVNMMQSARNALRRDIAMSTMPSIASPFIAHLSRLSSIFDAAVNRG
jgi:hypothetical protein